MKTCVRCLLEKPLADFRGRGACWVCKSIRSKELLAAKLQDPVYKEAWLAMHRASAKACKVRGTAHKPSKEESLAYYYTHKNRFPEKTKARIIAKRIKGAAGNEMHHWCYQLEFAKDLIELPLEVHRGIHRLMDYEQGVMLYRRRDTSELMDSKAKHEAFIANAIKIHFPSHVQYISTASP